MIHMPCTIFQGLCHFYNYVEDPNHCQHVIMRCLWWNMQRVNRRAQFWFHLEVASQVETYIWDAWRDVFVLRKMWCGARGWGKPQKCSKGVKEEDQRFVPSSGQRHKIVPDPSLLLKNINGEIFRSENGAIYIERLVTTNVGFSHWLWANIPLLSHGWIRLYFTQLKALQS